MPASTGKFEEAQAPNDRWTIDYKGQFRLRNGRYCYPHTRPATATHLAQQERFDSFLALAANLKRADV